MAVRAAGASCKTQLERARPAGSSSSSARRWSTSWSRVTPTGASSPPTRRTTRPVPATTRAGHPHVRPPDLASPTAMNALGWGNYANDHEDAQRSVRAELRLRRRPDHGGPGDHPALPDLVLAEQRGMTATFMPKPFTDRTGSGLHLHLSLWRDGEALFPAGDGPGRPRPRALPLAYSFIARDPRTRPGTAGGHRADGQLVQAHRRDHTRPARPGRPATPPTAATTAPTWSASPTTTASSCAAVTARPTRTWPSPLPSPPVWTASTASRPRTARDRHPRPAAAADAAARRRRASTATRSSPAPWTLSGRRASASTTPTLKREEFLSWHNRSATGRSDRYLTAF